VTQSQPHKLYIFLQGFDEENRYASYDHFLIGNKSGSYKISSLGFYKGTAGDAFTSKGSRQRSIVIVQWNFDLVGCLESIIQYS